MRCFHLVSRDHRILLVLLEGGVYLAVSTILIYTQRLPLFSCVNCFHTWRLRFPVLLCRDTHTGICGRVRLSDLKDGITGYICYVWKNVKFLHGISTFKCKSFRIMKGMFPMEKCTYRLRTDISVQERLCHIRKLILNTFSISP